MRRSVTFMGIIGLAAVAVLLLGGVVVVQVVMLSALAVAVTAGAVALSVEQSFRLLERTVGEPEVPVRRTGAAMTR